MSLDDDFNPQEHTDRLNELESFKSDFEGVSFYNKIADAIKESKTVEKEIKDIALKAVKDKVTWFLLGAVGLILMDLLLRAIPGIFSQF